MKASLPTMMASQQPALGPRPIKVIKLEKVFKHLIIKCVIEVIGINSGLLFSPWGLYHFITVDDEDGLLEEEDKDVEDKDVEDKDVEDKGAEDEGVIADNDGVTTASVGPAAY
jgi:hypothetical protein